MLEKRFSVFLLFLYYLSSKWLLTRSCLLSTQKKSIFGAHACCTTRATHHRLYKLTYQETAGICSDPIMVISLGHVLNILKYSERLTHAMCRLNGVICNSHEPAGTSTLSITSSLFSVLSWSATSTDPDGGKQMTPLLHVMGDICATFNISQTQWLSLPSWEQLL